MVQALSHTDQAITLLNREVTQMHNVVLQNWIALNTLTAVQGGTCALIRSKCYMYIPDSEHNVSLAFQALRTDRNRYHRCPRHRAAHLLVELSWFLEALHPFRG